MTDRERPKYRGIRTFRDRHGRFEFRYPSDWHVFELSDDRDGVMVSPEAQDPATYFCVWATRLQDAIVPEDLDVLREGVGEGLSQLPGLSIESASEDVIGNLVRLRRVYTFEQDGSIRRRKVWMLYVYKWLFALVAQGANADEYEHWSMMLEDCFDDFDLAPALWFASDRELAKELD